jgi:hypothetical protein
MTARTRLGTIALSSSTDLEVQEGVTALMASPTRVPDRNSTLRRPSTAAGALMALAAASFAAASVVHFGRAIPLGVATIRDPFPGAAVPEAVIAAVVAIGAVTVLTRRAASRGIALTATLFALLGTVYGLTVTLRSARTGDVAYHLGVLAILLLVLWLLPRTRQR